MSATETRHAEQIEALAECIKDLACTVGSNGNEWLQGKLSSVYERANAVVMAAYVGPAKTKNGALAEFTATLADTPVRVFDFEALNGGGIEETGRRLLAADEPILLVFWNPRMLQPTVYMDFKKFLVDRGATLVRKSEETASDCWPKYKKRMEARIKGDL